MTKEIIENDPYKSAGVDIDAGDDLISKIKEDVALTHNQNVLGNIGGFAGMYKLNDEFKNPVLVSCTDGVGTKVALAQEYNNLSGIGQDLVAMCVNDLIVCGAKPLFFLDYYASSKLIVDEASQVIKSISKACIDSGCVLLGGETAEMPGHYINNNFDLAGFSVGCVDEKKIIQSKDVSVGDVLIGIESSGPHSNGYSLIRKILSESKKSDNKKADIAKKLLAPTLLYPKLILNILCDYKINSISHITGGGLTENLPRSIPDDMTIEIQTNSWIMPEIFEWLSKEGNISNDNMYRIFNCGIGMVLIVDADQADKISNKISSLNFKNFIIGNVKEKIKDNSVVFS
tara:strand:+ start:1 stop:1032 length:1032 start_codon:yes stop_codon:yes gene_type:complete